MDAKGGRQQRLMVSCLSAALRFCDRHFMEVIAIA